MKMNFLFTVIARCKKIDRSVSESNFVDEKEDIELNFDIEKAGRFLFRFYNHAFNIGEYKILFKTSENGDLQGISLFKGDCIYIILNINQVINDVLKGYNYLVTMNKVVDIMEFDFNAAIDTSGIDEEF